MLGRSPKRRTTQAKCNTGAVSCKARDFNMILLGFVFPATANRP